MLQKLSIVTAVMAFLLMIPVRGNAQLHLLRLQSLCSRMHFCSRMGVKWSWSLTSSPPTFDPFLLTFGLYSCHPTATWLAAPNTISQVADNATCMPLSPSWVAPVLPVSPSSSFRIEHTCKYIVQPSKARWCPLIAYCFHAVDLCHLAGFLLIQLLLVTYTESLSSYHVQNLFKVRS